MRLQQREDEEYAGVKGEGRARERRRLVYVVNAITVTGEPGQGRAATGRTD